MPPTFLFVACLNLFDEAVTTKANRLTNLHQRRGGRNVRRREREGCGYGIQPDLKLYTNSKQLQQKTEKRKKNTEKNEKNIRKRITTMMRAQRRAAIKCSRTEHVKKRIAPEDPQRIQQQQGREKMMKTLQNDGQMILEWLL